MSAASLIISSFSVLPGGAHADGFTENALVVRPPYADS